VVGYILGICAEACRRDEYGFEYIVHAQSKCQKMNTLISEADIVERLSFRIYG
jgi:hypothetical protein